MIAQDLINEIEREETQEKEQNEQSKARANKFKQMFYKDIWNHEQADLNLSLVVGK